jgi:hypothetical protein
MIYSLRQQSIQGGEKDGVGEKIRNDTGMP